MAFAFPFPVTYRCVGSPLMRRESRERLRNPILIDNQRLARVIMKVQNIAVKWIVDVLQLSIACRSSPRRIS